MYVGGGEIPHLAHIQSAAFWAYMYVGGGEIPHFYFTHTPFQACLAHFQFTALCIHMWVVVGLETFNIGKLS